MAATIGIIGSVAGLASAGAGIANLVGGGTSNSGGTPQTATGGQSANLLSSAQMGQAGNQYLSDAMGLQGYGTGYASQFFPQVAQATQNAAYNPYGAQAIGGAQGAASYGTNVLAPYQAGAASQLSGLAGMYQPYAAGALGQAFSPTQGAAYEGQYLSQAATPTLGAAYAPQALATGFAPNNGLYKQQLQQVQDQSNAINAMYGLGNSPYGAGLTDQATQNFNNAFNLNQAQLQGAAANTYTGLMNNNLANQTGNLNAYNSLVDTQLSNTLGLGGLASTLGGQAGTLYGQGSTLGQGAFGTLGAAGAAPATAYQGLANNSLAAFGTGAQNANASLNPYTTYLNSLGNIIGLGQIGQQNAASQAQAGFNQNQAVGQNLGQSLSALTGGGQGSLQQLWAAINGSPTDYSYGNTGSYSDPNYDMSAYGLYG